MAPSNCVSCEGEKTDLVYQNELFSLLKCKNCSLVWKLVPNSGIELSEKINKQLFSDVDKRSGIRLNKKMAVNRLRILKSFAKTGKLLEVGAATGEFLEIAKRSGFDVLGIDLSENYIEYSRKKGLKVFHGKIEDLPNDNNSFDIIVMFHLIEHIVNPLSFLQEIKKRLKPDGLIYTITPNINSTTNGLFGYSHSDYHHPDHYFFYSTNTLGNIMKKAGFEVVYSGSKEYHHHLFTSLKAYIARRASISKSNQPHLEASIKPKTNKFNIKYLLSRMPYLLAYLFSPILIFYSYAVAKKNERQ